MTQTITVNRLPSRTWNWLRVNGAALDWDDSAPLLENFRAGIDSVLGAGSCHVLSIRREGGCMMEKM